MPIWAGAFSAVLLALGGSGLLALSLFATARLLHSESLGFAQQSVGDTHRLLSGQVQRELSNLQEGLVRTGEFLLRNTLEKGLGTTPGVETPLRGSPLVNSSAPAGRPEALTAGSAHLERLARQSRRKPAAKTKIPEPVLNPPASPPAEAPLVPVAVANLPSGVLQVSLWAHGLGDSSPSVRAESLLNPKYAALAASLKPLLRSADARDRTLVEEAFKIGHNLLVAQNVKGEPGRPSRILSVAIQISPAESSGGRGVLLAHYKLDLLDALLNADLLARSVLLDSKGRTLAGETAFGGETAKSLVLDAVQNKKERSGLIQDFPNPQGNPASGFNLMGSGANAPIFASFTRFQHFPLTLVTAISEGDVLTGMDSLLRIAAASVIAVFLILFVVAFSQSRRQLRKIQGQGTGASGGVGSDQGLTESVSEAAIESAAMAEGGERLYGAVLVVTLRGLQGRLDQAPLLLSVSELLKDFRGLLIALLEKSGGEWTQDLDASFAIAFADAPSEEGKPLSVAQTGAWKCVQLALAIRQQWHTVNTTRATEGHAPAYLGMAVHSAHGLKVRKERGLSAKFVTPIVHEARTLERLAASLGQDFLIPKSIFETLRTVLKVDLAGEAYLGDVSGLTSYYRVLGYLKGADGKEELIETPWMKTPVEGRASAIQMVEGAVRWFINNGSGIIGPFSPNEISSQLFAQEIDFDCECWREDRGDTRAIRESDLFTGSDDVGAVLWVYDGKLIHGPLSPGFLQTALRTGAIRAQGSFVCEGSTVQGWRPLEGWLASGSSSEASSTPSSGSSSEASSTPSSGSSTPPTPGATSAA